MQVITSKDNEQFMASIKTNKYLLPFVKVGDKIRITYNEGEISTISKVEMSKNNE